MNKYTDIDTFRFVLNSALAELPEKEITRLQTDAVNVLNNNTKAALDVIALLFVRNYLDIEDYLQMKIQVGIKVLVKEEEE